MNKKSKERLAFLNDQFLKATNRYNDVLYRMEGESGPYLEALEEYLEIIREEMDTLEGLMVEERERERRRQEEVERSIETIDADDIIDS